MANTFVQIGSTVTVGAGGAANIDFSSIPATYTDLVLKTSLRSNRTGDASDGISVYFNNVTTNRASSSLETNGTGVYAYTTTRNEIGIASASNATASIFGNAEIYIPNYAGSTNKSSSADGVSENNASAAYVGFVGNLWSNTAAINRITIVPVNGSSWNQYSTATLYGIKKN